MQTAQTIAAYATILWPVLLLLVTAIVAFGVGHVNAFLADRARADKTDQFWATVQRLVLGAEQSIVGSQAKFSWVYSLATPAAKALGLDLTQAQVTATIEAAVAGVNQAQGQPIAAVKDAHPDLVPGDPTVTPAVDDHTAIIDSLQAQLDAATAHNASLETVVGALKDAFTAATISATTTTPGAAPADTVGADTQAPTATATEAALATVSGTVKTPDGQTGTLVGSIVPPTGAAS
jgi:hypothetical protein